ncbi:unnamed protein product [Mucor hiemalis]
MGDITEQEKLERRRARRQQRILASAESRLSMITGTHSGFRESASPTPSPSTSTTSLPISVKEINTLAEHYPSPSDPRRQKYEDHLTPTPSTSSSSVKPASQLHRPAVQKIIAEEQARELNEQGFLGGKIPQLLLSTMLKRTNPTLKRRRLPENKYWNVLHFISMVWLGFLAVYEEVSYHGVKQALLLIRDPAVKETAPRHFPVFWYFVTLEIALHFGRSIYQPEYKSTDETKFLSIASQLPETLQQPAYILQKYGTLINDLFRDLCIVIFVIGFSCITLNIVFLIK